LPLWIFSDPKKKRFRISAKFSIVRFWKIVVLRCAGRYILRISNDERERGREFGLVRIFHQKRTMSAAVRNSVDNPLSAYIHLILMMLLIIRSN